MKKIIISLFALMACMSISAQVVKVYDTKTNTLLPEATYTNSANHAYKVVFEETQNNYIGGYQYVDLGLPSGTLWATCNVGADSPEDSGLYFAWGETTGYTSSADRDFSWDNYSLKSIADAATANWGNTWRMPTEAEWTELVENCTWTRTSKNGVSAYTVTSKNNGNSILLLGGYYDGTDFYDDDASYWSNTLNADDNNDAKILYWDLVSSPYIETMERRNGGLIRPVVSSESLKTPPTCSFSAILEVGGTYQLKVDTNTGGAVTYTSSDESVATVDASTGRVVGVGEGTSIITATTSGKAVITASYTFKVVNVEYATVTNTDGTTTRWAKMNVGATSIADDPATAYGDYFAWGELEPYYSSKTYTSYNTAGTITYKSGKTGYNWTNYCGSSSLVEWSPAPYNRNKVLKSAYDVATQTLGETWRMPTETDFANLYAACGQSGWLRDIDKWTAVSSNPTQGVFYIGSGETTVGSTIYKVPGLLFVPDPTNLDDVVFFPIAGYMDNGSTNIRYPGNISYYWSSTLYTGDGYTYSAYDMYYSSIGLSIDSNAKRFCGFNVRPVSDY